MQRGTGLQLDNSCGVSGQGCEEGLNVSPHVCGPHLHVPTPDEPVVILNPANGNRYFLVHCGHISIPMIVGGGKGMIV